MQEKKKEGDEMFYSHYLLSRKGPLGTIWIAAHCYRKLKKHHIAEIDISSSVDKIMLADVPIAFRLLGFLLIGVVRIYSKKVECLYHDCNEALVRIKDSCVTGKIGLSKDDRHTPYFPITLPQSFELDAFDFEISEDGSHVRHSEEITLEEARASDERLAPMEKMLYCSVETTTHHQMQSSSLTLADDFFLPQSMDIDLGIRNFGASIGLEDSREKLLVNQLHLEGHVDLEMFCGVLEPLDAGQCFDGPSDFDEQIKLPEMLLSDVEKSHIVTTGSPLHEPPINNPDKFPRASVDAMPREMVIPTPPNKEREIKSRKRKRCLNGTIVLSNEALRQGLHNPSSLVHTRRKAPHTILDAWKAYKLSSLAQSFLDPLTLGISLEIKALFTKNYVDHIESEEVVEVTTQSDEENLEISTKSSDGLSPATALVNPSMSSEASTTTMSNEVRSELLTNSGGEETPAVDTLDFLLNLMDEEASSHEAGHWNQDSWSTRTRAVAKYLCNSFLNQEGKQKGVLSLGCLLEGRTRKACARLFYETLFMQAFGCDIGTGASVILIIVPRSPAIDEPYPKDSQIGRPYPPICTLLALFLLFNHVSHCIGKNLLQMSYQGTFFFFFAWYVNSVM